MLRFSLYDLLGGGGVEIGVPVEMSVPSESNPFQAKPDSIAAPLHTAADLVLGTTSCSNNFSNQWKVRFNDVEEIQVSAIGLMGAIKQKCYQRYFHQWKECCNNCTQSQGHQTEGDKTNYR